MSVNSLKYINEIPFLKAIVHFNWYLTNDSPNILMNNIMLYSYDRHVGSNEFICWNSLDFASYNQNEWTFENYANIDTGEDEEWLQKLYICPYVKIINIQYYYYYFASWDLPFIWPEALEILST